ncbi:MAG: HAMP domain-containing sensor histidine kinase [Alphaproteobacteria bacterium]|nr:HAMP domain-containing sensor histidine kinase [Alphaproteobacteria bacterium]
MELNKLIQRQLKRSGMTLDSLPTDQEEWRQFIQSVSNAYENSDQERYLLERSMELSSQELLSLNEKLENAQSISRLGYWSYDKLKDRVQWSNTLSEICGLNASITPINYENFLSSIHEEHRTLFQEKVSKICVDYTPFDCEIKVKNYNNNDYFWYFISVTYDKNPEHTSNIFSGIAMDISKRKHFETELNVSNQKLITTARLAGMADVATSVLHNIGNVLNSANVSLGLILQKLKNDHYQKLIAVIQMIKDNLPNIVDYIKDDPKGKVVPRYLVSIGETLAKDYEIFGQEIQNISKHLDHMKEIVSKQQNISRVVSLKEKTFLHELINDALQISGGENLKEYIQLNKNYTENDFVLTDKSKATQIMINLIKNAKEAIIENRENQNKELTISVQKNSPEEFINISVEDSGIGITDENISKIFTFGFTTKENGHGFGLHSSVLAARELGGDLIAESKGKNQGSIFTLILPLQ